MKTFENVYNSEQIQKRIKEIENCTIYSKSSRAKKIKYLEKACRELADMSELYELIFERLVNNPTQHERELLMKLENLVLVESNRLQRFLKIHIPEEKNHNYKKYV